MRTIMLTAALFAASTAQAAEQRWQCETYKGGQAALVGNFAIDGTAGVGRVTINGIARPAKTFITGFTLVWDLHDGWQMHLSPESVASLVYFAEGEDRAKASTIFNCKEVAK